MDYKTTVFTRILNELEYKTELDRTIKILGQNKIDEVEMLFGWAWGNDYKTGLHFLYKSAIFYLKLTNRRNKIVLLSMFFTGKIDLIIILVKNTNMGRNNQC